jgi:hypothetical protein
MPVVGALDPSGLPWPNGVCIDMSTKKSERRRRQQEEQELRQRRRGMRRLLVLIGAGALIILGAVLLFRGDSDDMVWSPAHGHYHPRQ